MKRKIIALLLVFVMILCMSACSQYEEDRIEKTIDGEYTIINMTMLANGRYESTVNFFYIITAENEDGTIMYHASIEDYLSLQIGDTVSGAVSFYKETFEYDSAVSFKCDCCEKVFACNGYVEKETDE